MTSARQSGLTLLELLTALTIGIVLIGAIIQVAVLHSQQFARTEALAALQEQAATALRLIRADIRMAGHAGLAGSVARINGRSLAAADNPSALATPSRCPPRFTLAAGLAVAAAASVDHWHCQVTAIAGNDALALRYASAAIHPPQHNRLQLASRVGEAQLIDDGLLPSAAGLAWQLQHWQVFGYYIAPSSTLFPGRPVLRRLTLNAMTTGPLYIDEEITVDVERLKLRLAIDGDMDGVADRWVAPDDPLLAVMQANATPLHPPLAVEVSLVLKSELPNWPDTTPPTLTLAGGDWTPPVDGHLRLATVAIIDIANQRT